MLTFFSTPKAFIGHNRIIQLNAIRSWTLLKPRCEIILIGDDPGVKETASEFGLRYIPDVKRSSHGTPLVNSIFNLAQKTASNEMMCYINADILLMQDFMEAVQKIIPNDKLLVGRRWDLDINELINFTNESWEKQTRTVLDQSGVIHSVTGMDYFVFKKGFFGEIPDFYLGRTAWDNWMIYRARTLKKDVVDITPSTTVIHQNHDYSHVSGDRQVVFKGPEAEWNQKLLGGWEHSFNTKHATLVLAEGRLRRNTSFQHLLAEIEIIPVLHPRLKFLAVLRRAKKSILELTGKAIHFLSGKPN